ncbi:transcriptional regulator [Caballeronia sordidicola]|jgi:predicted transcriptional regulator|uniref:transcriptional regulator n=1 Tax=Caballeronia sordidicola TaxID=196367 RepID=UPI000A37E376|nr:transcriptional regulator [Caballeronia sordidicola]
MENTEHVLISLEKRHADNIFAGTKHVELRRRAMNVKAGTIVWIYVKLPIGRVVGCAQVSASHLLAPSTLWRRFADVCGISRREFFDYFGGRSRGFALGLKDPQLLSGALSLAELRAASTGFQPPQFFIRLAHDSPLVHVMEEKRTKTDHVVSF